jgi:glutathione S-transferase
VDLKNKPRELLELNPYAKVPVLIDGDAVVYESAIINEYLEESYPAVRLMPVNPLERAKVRIWIDFFNSRIHPAAHDIAHDKEPKKAREKLFAHLHTLNRELGDKPFMVGEYSLADVTFIPFYVRRQRYDLTLEGAFPNLTRWGEALICRPAVASTL